MLSTIRTSLKTPGMTNISPDTWWKAINVIIGQEFAQLKQIHDQSNLAYRRIAEGVGTVVSQNTVQTQREFIDIIAAVQQEVMASFTGLVARVFRQWRNDSDRLQMYERAMDAFTARFKLYISDAQVIQATKNIDGLMTALANRIREGAQTLVYDSLEDAIMEAVQGIPDDAFPIEYTELLIEQVEYLRSINAIPIYGPTVTSWTVSIDMDKLFGNGIDLQRAYHYQAMLNYRQSPKGDVNGFVMISDLVEKVDLPYMGQPLRYSRSSRYMYWQQMWAANNAPAMYYSGYKNTSQMRSSKIKYFNNRSNQAAKLNIQARKVAKQLAATPSEDAAKTARLRREQIRIAQSTFQQWKFFQERSASVPTEKGVRIPAGAKQRTINARVAFWRSHRKAPIWMFLENGQLEFAPRIPPRGLSLLFYQKMQAAVTVLAREIYNKEFSGAEGFWMDPSGRYRMAAGMDAYSIPFSNIKPTTRPGGYLPNKLVFDVSKILDTAARSAREAMAISNKMGGQDAAVKIEQAQQAIAASQRASQLRYENSLRWPEYFLFPDANVISTEQIMAGRRALTGQSSYTPQIVEPPTLTGLARYNATRKYKAGLRKAGLL